MKRSYNNRKSKYYFADVFNTEERNYMGKYKMVYDPKINNYKLVPITDEKNNKENKKVN